MTEFIGSFQDPDTLRSSEAGDACLTDDLAELGEVLDLGAQQTVRARLVADGIQAMLTTLADRQ